MAASSSMVVAGGQVASGLAGLLGASGQGEILTKQAEIEQSAMNHQADLLEMQASDIMAATDEDDQMRQQQVKQMIGSQKASLAGQGIVVEGVVGQALEKDEKKILREDQQAIKANAWRQAHGLEMRAQDFKNKSVYAGIEARHKAGTVKAEASMSFGRSLIGAANTLATDPFKSPKKQITTSNKNVAYNYQSSYGSNSAIG